MTQQKLLEISGLNIGFKGPLSPMTVQDITLNLHKGELVALVGESGSGKSLLAHTIAGILSQNAQLTASRFVFSGIDLSSQNSPEFDSVRGREIGIVFQNSRTALNPLRRIGKQLADVIAEHQGLRQSKLKQAVIHSLAQVRIPEPALRAKAYPHELSGGMCQRVMMAIALAGNPSLLIADEPTTGLDTTTQAAILDLIISHARERDMAMLLITHDLALARTHTQRIIVMHAGQIVEDAPTESLFLRPQHPYSKALINSTLAGVTHVSELQDIPGSMPVLSASTPACRFASRCPQKIARCESERPFPSERFTDHRAACWVA